MAKYQIVSVSFVNVVNSSVVVVIVYLSSFLLLLLLVGSACSY